MAKSEDGVFRRVVRKSGICRDWREGEAINILLKFKLDPLVGLERREGGEETPHPVG